MKSRVPASNVTDVTLEVLHVDCVESDDGLLLSAVWTMIEEASDHTYRIKSNISLCHSVAVIVWARGLCEFFLRSVQ